MNDTTRGILSTSLAVIALLLFGLSAWVVISGGGGDATIYGVRLSIRNGSRPFLAAGAIVTVLTLIAPAWRSRIERVRQRLSAMPPAAFTAIALILAAGVLLIGIRYGRSVAAAADAYGYVSQAHLWLHGTPRIEQPLPLSFPWPDAQYTFAPLGYRPSVDGQAIVPTYPPGYPLLIAAMLFALGERGQYLVVPLLAAITIVATFLLGRRVAGHWIGLAAAIWLGASAVFLFQTCIPMSDVPAAAAWTIALLLMLQPTIPRAGLAGIAASIAILIRPNLAPLAALLLVMDPIGTAFEDRGRRRSERWFRVRSSILRGVVFMLAMLPGLIALGWINRTFYGSPFASGYGDVRALFAFGYFPTNLRHYVYWFWDTQTIAIFLAPLALWSATTDRDRVMRARLLLFVCGVAACYAFYLPFDTWDYLRFFLPAYPAILVLSAIALVDIITIARARMTQWSSPPQPIVAVIAVTLIGTVTLSNWRETLAKGAFVNWESIQRFIDVPAYAHDHLPANAIYITRIYSGSLRYYGDRPTIRWDVLDPAWLERAIDLLRARGFVPLIAIEDGDDDRDFRERFRGTRYGALDWPPVYEYRKVQTVRIFDPADRR